MKVEDLKFGDYCVIEQKRYGVDNEHYKYKVIGSGRANYYRGVPVDSNDVSIKSGEVCGIVKAICCGVCEEKVETFRLQDISI